MLQSIANIAEICAQKVVRNVVLSPGSRCAPLTIAFVRHPEIQVKTISDERSAAFIALGMAQQLKQPVALVCTSGSAAYNYAPAVAEAFFQQIPLIIFTADRPPEWIDQLDGQTIRQFDIYHNHIKKSFQLPVSYEHPDEKWHCERIISEAINLSKSLPPGPVHVNVPLREPLYPAPDEKIIFNKNIKIIEEQSTEIKLNASEHNKLIKKFFQFKRILIVAGQSDYKEKMSEILAESIHKFKLPFVADIISNFHAIEEIIRHHDHFIGSDKNYKILNPDLLITFGKSVLSKNLKIFLRKNKPLEHWHFQQAGEIADTFQSLTHVIRESAEMFFQDLNEMDNDAENKQVEYFNDWHNQNAKSKDYLEQFLSQSEFGEFKAAGIILENLPSCNLHISNSMPVRYANMIGLYTRHTHIEVNVNRGTSGIDGSNSTATGASMASGKITVLITGDMAFFYDRNAFWHNYPLPNLKIIILNNHSGGIFRMIDGPSNLPELEEFFETYQPLSAKLLAEEFDFEYQMCDNEKTLIESLKTCVQKNNKTQILEILTDTKKNHSIYKSFIENFS